MLHNTEPQLFVNRMPHWQAALLGLLVITTACGANENDPVDPDKCHTIVIEEEQPQGEGDFETIVAGFKAVYGTNINIRDYGSKLEVAPIDLSGSGGTASEDKDIPNSAALEAGRVPIFRLKDYPEIKAGYAGTATITLLKGGEELACTPASYTDF